MEFLFSLRREFVGRYGFFREDTTFSHLNGNFLHAIAHRVPLYGVIISREVINSESIRQPSACDNTANVPSKIDNDFLQLQKRVPLYLKIPDSEIFSARFTISYLSSMV